MLCVEALTRRQFDKLSAELARQFFWWQQVSPFRRHWQPDLLAECDEPGIPLISEQERIVEQAGNTRVALVPGALKPGEHPVRLLPCCIDLRDLKSRLAGMLIDQRLQRRIGFCAIAVSGIREGERVGLPNRI